MYDLLPLISNPNFTIDLVLLDLPGIHEELGDESYELINTINTLLKTTLHRNWYGRTKLRNVMVAASLDKNCDPTLVKDTVMMDLNGVYPDDEDFLTLDREQALRDLLAGNNTMPQYFKDIIRPPKKNRVKNQDEIYLTPRQEQIVKLICERGSSNKVIAKMLNISLSTVKLHVTAAMKKYKAKNRTQLALFVKQGKKSNPPD
jgi:DNA-binding NarL/FixJ family response regulator